MNDIIIIRNNKQYGPYSIDVIKSYVESGQLLKCDTAFVQSDPSLVRNVSYFLKQQKVKVRIPHNGNIIHQIKDIGSELILPKDARNTKQWKSDQRLLLLSLIGLLPLVLGCFMGSGYLMFYAISLFFATIWGLFFYYFFKTPQVKLKTTILVFFLTQAFVFAIFGFGLNYINPIYWLGEPQDLGFLLQLVFFVLGVGVTEEFVKSIPIYIISSRGNEPLIPQTLVFYGLMSGIAFGVFEGVQYQMGVNSTLDYGSGFFYNIARLTSLPFIHAIWCGIAGYFISFAKLYPKYRKSLYILALAVPAVLHGLYDTFCGLRFVGMSFGLMIAFFAVALLMTYLKNGVNYQSKLRN